MRLPPAVGRMTAILAVMALLAGCGSTVKGPVARASGTGTEGGTCPETVVRTLSSVLQRIYGEGLESERTGSAKHLIEYSLPLRGAIERASPAAARAAAKELLSTGHMTNLKVVAGGRTLVNVGGEALTPLHGVIKDLAGRPIATYQTSVWSDRGFAAEGRGVTEGLIAIRRGSHTLGASTDLGGATLPSEGTLTRQGTSFQYTSFPATAYPSGAVRIYLLRALDSATPLCGATSEDTLVNTVSHIADLIYAGETGGRTLVQLQRIQSDRGLLAAVARRDPLATRVAVERLLHQHVVRLRVFDATHRLLVDDGGPYVLGPVGASLRLHGRRIGSFLLSIQDDEGYKRLAGRLAGLKVLMYMSPAHVGGQPRLVKNSLGPSPGNVPASGPYTYHGANYRVHTLHAAAFPSGPLTIRVLIPIPYS